MTKYRGWVISGPAKDLNRVLDAMAQSCEPHWSRDRQLEQTMLDGIGRGIFRSSKREIFLDAAVWFVEIEPGVMFVSVHPYGDSQLTEDDYPRVFDDFYAHVGAVIERFPEIHLAEAREEQAPESVVGSVSYAAWRIFVSNYHRFRQRVPQPVAWERWLVFVCFSHYDDRQKLLTDECLRTLLIQEGLPADYARELSGRWREAMELIECFTKMPRP